MRHLFSTLLLLGYLYSHAQTQAGSDPGSQFPFLQRIQDFVDKNEQTNSSDSVKRTLLYQKLKEEMTAVQQSESAFILMHYWALNLSREQADTLYHLIDTSLYGRPEKALADNI